MTTTDQKLTDAVKRMKSSGSLLLDALSVSNFVPHGYPAQEVKLIVERLLRVEDQPTEDDISSIYRLSNKLMSCYERASPDSNEEHSDLIAAAHTRLFMHVTQAKQAAQVEIANLPPVNSVYVKSSEEYKQALDDIFAGMEDIRKSTQATNVVVGNITVTSKNYAALSFGHVKLSIDKLFSNTIDLNLELNSEVLDLGWISAYASRVKHYSDVIYKYLAQDQLGQPEENKVILLARRVADLGAALFHKVKQIVGSLRQRASGNIDSTSEYRTQLDEDTAKAVEAARQAMLDAIAESQANMQFIANLSYELRDSLNLVLGYSQSALESSKYIGISSHHNHLQQVQDSALEVRHFLDKINDLFDLGRKAVVLDEEEINILVLFNKLLEEFRSAGDERQLDLLFETDGGLKLLADQQRIRQVLICLLDNAIKFTPTGGMVRLRAWVNDVDQLTFEIQDSGIGMAEDEVKRAMALFVGSGGGRGLGLPIASAFLKVHGSSLQLISAPGLGTTATFTFPRSRTVGNV